jgi:hypothetical protein
MGVTAVGRQCKVAIPEGGCEPYGNCLLTDSQMSRAMNDIAQKELIHRFLEATNSQHLPVVFFGVRH